MRIEPLGDGAYILRDLRVPPYRLADHLNRVKPAGLIEASASYETVGIYVEPDTFQPADLIEEVPMEAAREEVTHLIPVCFEMGEDLLDSADTLGLSADSLISSFCGESYRCFAIGFCPGFPYLGYLPKELRGLDRLPSPRLRVPTGSVAITGDQAGIYPSDHPGGWRILGRTPLKLVDAASDYFPISAGHLVTFVPVDRDEFESRRGQRL